MKNSTVLGEHGSKEIHDDDVYLEALSGEILQFKSFSGDQVFSIGVRHELPDSEGRVWRTECVLTCLDGESILRVKGQCVAVSGGAFVLVPKKPYFISQAMEDNWGATDSKFLVQQLPHYLSESDEGAAAEIVMGHCTSLLPCVYVSRGNDNSVSVDVAQLARKLAGLAHVVVEPSRAFSFGLMESTLRKNPYGGAVGVFLNGVGEVSRHFADGFSNRSTERTKDLVDTVVGLVSKRTATRGWEWQSLQENQGRALRARLSENASEELSSYIEIFDAEVRAKDEKINNLEQLLEIAKHEKSVGFNSSTDLLPADLSAAIGPQLYDGEFSDRLRLFMEKMIVAAKPELDARTCQMIDRVLSHSSYSGRSAALTSQVKAAGKDGMQMSAQLGHLLVSLGYTKTSENTHLKFVPPESLFGLPQEILPSTPSDSQRAGKNKSADIIRNLGLNRLR